MTPAIRIQGATKRYGAVTALDQLSLTIQPGEIVALLGPNGAGKSTANELVLGLQAPTSGSVEVFGLAPTAAVRAGRTGAMLQNGRLLDTSVRELLALMHGVHAHPLPIKEVAERAGITPLLKRPTTKLSGGEAQRVRYALAILADPDLILLDEPTVGMDVGVRRDFWASMRDFTAQGRTVMFATHYLDEADEFADRIVVLAHGRVVADGPGEQIKQTIPGREVSFRAPDGFAVSALPSVTAAERRGQRYVVHCTDSDAVLRALVATSQASAIEVAPVSLEDAFLRLTTERSAA